MADDDFIEDLKEFLKRDTKTELIRLGKGMVTLNEDMKEKLSEIEKLTQIHEENEKLIRVVEDLAKELKELKGGNRR